MGNVAAASHRAAVEAGEKLDKRIAGNKIFCLDGEEEIEKDVAIGEHHAESKQDSINGNPSSQHALPIVHPKKLFLCGTLCIPMDSFLFLLSAA